MGRRITRKQLKKDDEFVSAAELIFRWVADNRRAILAGLAAVTMMEQLSNPSPSRFQRSQSPAKANTPPPGTRIWYGTFADPSRRHS